MARLPLSPATRPHSVAVVTPRRGAGGWASAARRQALPVAASAAAGRTFDVVVVGAGIVGLASALQVLRDSPDVSVCIAERAERLCAEATGAGQGYLWMVHRDPTDSANWQLAARGRELWEREVGRLGMCAPSLRCPLLTHRSRL